MNRETVEKLIDDALKHDPAYNVEDVLSEVEEYRAELIAAERSLVVWNILEKPNARQFHIWIAAGDLEELMSLVYPVLEVRAMELGCDVMTISGRRGWIRKLKPHGFKEAATVGVKTLK